MRLEDEFVEMFQQQNLLIHWPIDGLKPTGGPAGYLYNLNKGLEAINASGYSFLPSDGPMSSSNDKLKRFVPKRLKDIRRLKRFMALADSSKNARVDYGQYNCIHFHSTEDLFLHRYDLANYSGKVVLTSHSPCVYHMELIARLNLKDVKTHRDSLRKLEAIDEYAFSRADYVIFPCQEAEEPYFHTWNKYCQVRDASKMRYIPTGISSCVAKIDRNEVRSRYGIPVDAFVLTYVGRHNEIKGYGDLRGVAPALLERFDNLWFLNAGKPSPLKGLNHPRWIEVGWTDDPYSIISAADLFVLPNRETYFDLILLEVMSLGQIAIISRTGGNKYFAKYSLPGLRYFDKVGDLPDAIAAIQSTPTNLRNEWAAMNKSVFESAFSCPVFAQGYIDLIRSLGV